jgi:hypothetical protein
MKRDLLSVWQGIERLFMTLPVFSGFALDMARVVYVAPERFKLFLYIFDVIPVVFSARVNISCIPLGSPVITLDLVCFCFKGSDFSENNTMILPHAYCYFVHACL